MASITPTNPPCSFKIYVVAQASGVLTLERTNGTTTVSEPLNNGGVLAANTGYFFYADINSGDSINLQYSVTTTFTTLVITELDLTHTPTLTVGSQTIYSGSLIDPRSIRSLIGSDNPDITVNQSKALGSSTLPVYIRALTSSDNPDITVNQSKALGSSTLPVYIRTLGSTDNPDITVNQSKALGSSTLPVYIRDLGASDNPDITVNQSKALGSATLPVYIRPLNSSDNPDITVNQSGSMKISALSSPFIALSKVADLNLAVTANTNIL